MSGVEHGETETRHTRRTRRFYQAPWLGGTFDLDRVVGVNYEAGREGGRLTVQLRGGGYQRGPEHPDAREVTADVEAVLASLDNSEVYRFDRER